LEKWCAYRRRRCGGVGGFLSELQDRLRNIHGVQCELQSRLSRSDCREDGIDFSPVTTSQDGHCHGGSRFSLRYQSPYQFELWPISQEKSPGIVSASGPPTNQGMEKITACSYRTKVQ